jgi:ribosomal protein S6--L-glutamate ligase
MRVVLIGDTVIGGYWRVGEGFHNNVAQGGQIIHGPIPDEARRLVEYIARQTGINHAGFDIAMVGNHCYLLEFNRLFGTQGISGLGVDINQLILEYLGRERTPPSDPPTLELVV